jgi:hypothetical protein
VAFNLVKYNIVDEEIIIAISYYESISYNLGVKFENEIEKALDKIQINAHFYHTLEDNYHRRILIEGFPYAFIYCIDGSDAIVKMLFPQKDDPARLWTQLGI